MAFKWFQIKSSQAAYIANKNALVSRLFGQIYVWYRMTFIIATTFLEKAITYSSHGFLYDELLFYSSEEYMDRQSFEVCNILVQQK